MWQCVMPFSQTKGGPPPVKPASDAKLIQSIVALVVSNVCMCFGQFSSQGCELMLNMLYFAFNAPQAS